MALDIPKTVDNDYQVQHEGEDDDEQSELAHLQADADMPLDELLKFYRKNEPTIINDSSQDEEEDDDDDWITLSDTDDDDTEDSLYEPDTVKFINVGDEYQAHVEAKAEYDLSNEDCDDREVPVDELLWSSSSVSDIDNENIDEYLKTVHNEYPSSDDEISLQTLFICQLNTELALVKFRQLSVKTIYSYSAWSSDEIQQFEEGLRECGKNFYEISVFKCPNRSVREIVHFYYKWKKSERYQSFIKEQQRINSLIKEQQRINSLTSVSDIIEKLIEEREHKLCNAAGVVDSTNPSSFLSTDFKLHAPFSSNSSISFVTIHQQETTKRSFDQVDNNEEPSSKKRSLNTKTSSAEATAAIV